MRFSDDKTTTTKIRFNTTLKVMDKIVKFDLMLLLLLLQISENFEGTEPEIVSDEEDADEEDDEMVIEQQCEFNR